MNNSTVLLLGALFLSLASNLRSQTPVDISLETPFDDSSTIKFLEGGSSYGMMLRYNGSNSVNGLQVIPVSPHLPEESVLTVDRDEGWVSVGKGGDGNKLLVLNTDRSWAFSQHSSGASTALRLANVSETNDNKNFLIDTEGGVGIRDNSPLHQLSLGSSLAHTKLALFETGDNSSHYGLGVTSGRFHFNLGNPNARFVFRSGPSSTAPIIFTIEGSGNMLAPGLEDFGNGAPMLYSTSGGEFGYNTSSRRFKTNIKTWEEDWSKLLLVRPVIYGRHATPEVPEIGYIAEELDSIGLGHVVGLDKEGKPLYINYDKLVIYLTEIVKQHHADLAEKQEEIDRLTAAMKEVDRLGAALDAINLQLKASSKSTTGAMPFTPGHRTTGP